MKSTPSIDRPAAGVRRPVVAVVGNPNAGKTTLFNSLTGSRQKVGNYPGVTVERVSGEMRVGDLRIDCVDIPGLYSLSAQSTDEQVAVDALLGKSDVRPDLVVCVVDATNLERNLFLFSQVAERGFPMLVALTMADRLPAKNQTLSVDALSHELGVDVVGVVGHRNLGIDKLRDAIVANLQNPRYGRGEVAYPPEFESEVANLKDLLARAGVDADAVEIRNDLFAPTPQIAAYLKDFQEYGAHFAEAKSRLAASGLLKPSVDVQTRYDWAKRVQDRAVQSKPERPRRSVTDRVDLLLTHRVFGLVFFVALMYLVFVSIYWLATPIMDGITDAFGWVGDRVSPLFGQNEMLRSFVVDGLINGVGSALVFLPQILILFFFIAVLEGTGYLARAAFLMDRLLGWCGLNGRAFIPLLSSFACAIPGIMAARVMPDQKSRLATILVAPLMSCSARLPVYALLIGAFIQPLYGSGWAGFAFFAMHALGMVLSIPIVYFFNRKMLKGRRLPFVLELPPYQMPKWRDVWIAMYSRGMVFLKTAGTIILAMTVLIWALGYFPRLSPEATAQIEARATASGGHPEKMLSEAQLEQSILGRFGKAIEPVFLPAGFDWRISTGILSAFPARETVVSSLGIIFSLGSDEDENSPDLRKTIQAATWPDGRPLFTPWTAVGLMVFFALCAQCMATLAAVKRETNSWKWPLFMFTYMTGLAYIAAVLIYQIGLRFGG